MSLTILLTIVASLLAIVAGVAVHRWHAWRTLACENGRMLLDHLAAQPSVETFADPSEDVLARADATIRQLQQALLDLRAEVAALPNRAPSLSDDEKVRLGHVEAKTDQLVFTEAVALLEGVEGTRDADDPVAKGADQ